MEGVKGVPIFWVFWEGRFTSSRARNSCNHEYKHFRIGHDVTERDAGVKSNNKQASERKNLGSTNLHIDHNPLTILAIYLAARPRWRSARSLVFRQKFYTCLLEKRIRPSNTIISDTDHQIIKRVSHEPA